MFLFPLSWSPPGTACQTQASDISEDRCPQDDVTPKGCLRKELRRNWTSLQALRQVIACHRNAHMVQKHASSIFSIPLSVGVASYSCAWNVVVSLYLLQFLVLPSVASRHQL